MKIKLYVSTGFANCKHEDILEIDDQEWLEMTTAEQEAYMDEAAMDFMNDRIECGAYPVEDGEEE